MHNFEYIPASSGKVNSGYTPCKGLRVPLTLIDPRGTEINFGALREKRKMLMVPPLPSPPPCSLPPPFLLSEFFISHRLCM
jgi:hypothetical protein